MRVLVIDGVGGAFDWVLRVRNAGHEVKWYIKPRNRASSAAVGDGFDLDKIDSWEKWTIWADLIVVTDSAFYMQKVQKLFDRGFPVFGPNLAGVRLEKDRAHGMRVMQDYGIQVPPFVQLESVLAAEEYILKNKDKVFVVKPSGDIAAERSMSHVSKSADDLIFTLRKWKRLHKTPKKFLLQEKISGVEMGVGGWFGLHGWSKWWEENFEFKKLMPGDIGPNCGEQGTVMRYTRKSKLAKKMLEPLTDYLHEIDYVGNVDVNCKITEKGEALPMEFTCRLGWPAFCLQQRIHEGDPVEWMKDLLEGRDTLKAKEDIIVGVVMSQPDYPYHNFDPEEVAGMPLYGLEDVWEDVHLQEIQLGTYPCIEGRKVGECRGYLTAGDYILVATGAADSVSKAAEKAYKVINKISSPASLMYRDDIGKRLKKELPMLQEHGYAVGMEYS